MKKTKYTCDIDGCNNEIKEHRYIEMRLTAIFITNQTDGASSEPYLDDIIIDMCADCYLKMLLTRMYIVAIGAQGHNQHYLGGK